MPAQYEGLTIEELQGTIRNMLRALDAGMAITHTAPTDNFYARLRTAFERLKKLQHG